MNDVQKKKEERIAWFLSKKITIQPYILLVGEEVHQPTSILVCVNNYTYTLPSVFAALDICLKAFHFLDAKYTVQSEHIWLLLQLGVYQFETKFDSKIISIIEVLQDMKTHEEAVPPA